MSSMLLPSRGADYPIASLYVGDLHPDVNEAMLFEKFTQVGPVLSVRVCRDVVTRRSLGYAYVNFEEPADAEKALDTMNSDILKGRPMRIMFYQRDPSLRHSGFGIFINNLDKRIDNRALYDTFSAFGPVLSCRVEYDANGISKGCGFVNFEAQESADMAIAKVNGMDFDGKKVYVAKWLSKEERKKCEQDQEQKYTNVYVKNFGKDLNDEQLHDLFSKFGKILSATVMMDPNTGESRGFGFVDFESHESAVKAVEELNGKTVNSHVIFCGRAMKRKERQTELQQRFEAEKKERYNEYQGVNLYVKNLEDEVDDERLRKEFSKFGDITSAKVMSDEAGMSKGFGFVCFSSPVEATKAVTEMNGRIIVSRRLYVALAQSKEERQAHLANLKHQRMARNGRQVFPQMAYLTRPPAQRPYLTFTAAGPQGGQQVKQQRRKKFPSAARKPPVAVPQPQFAFPQQDGPSDSDFLQRTSLAQASSSQSQEQTILEPANLAEKLTGMQLETDGVTRGRICSHCSQRLPDQGVTRKPTSASYSHADSANTDPD